MNLSRVDIYNMALARIKVGKRVRHVDDPTVREFMLPQSWGITMGRIMNLHPWKFATVNRKLAKVETERRHDAAGDKPEEEKRRRAMEIAPAAVYGFAWVYPTDCQKLIDIGMVSAGERFMDFATQFPWTIQAGREFGRVIRTMHDRACAKYISDSVPEVYWPGPFRDAFIWALASEITRSINASDADADYRMQQAQQAFIAARAADVEEQGMSIQRNGNWVESRNRFGDQLIGEHDLFDVGNFGMGYCPYMGEL